MASVPQIEMHNHPTSPVHKIVKAISCGRVYAVTSAEPFPTLEEAQQLWREDRKAFRPYDETTGRYCRYPSRGLVYPLTEKNS
jgi:hypothetical protein